VLKLNNENCLTKFIMVVVVAVAAAAAAAVVGTVVAVLSHCTES
jgi:type III secretory pathway component EscS